MSVTKDDTPAVATVGELLDQVKVSGTEQPDEIKGVQDGETKGRQESPKDDDAKSGGKDSETKVKPNPQGRKPDWKRKGQTARPHHHQRRDPKDAVSAEKLHRESMDAKRAPARIFDGFARNRVELAGWLKDNMPSDVKRSDGVGAIVVMAKNRSQEAVLTFEEKLERGLKAHEEWMAMTQAATPDSPLTFKDVGRLAEKHELKGGKWMFHVNRKDVDALWRQLAWAVGFDKFPENVISASVTPVDDLGHDSAQDKGIHVISLWNNDFRDDETLLRTEKVVRRTLNVKKDMIYKPDVYSGIGIYRNNPWKLSPVMYSSKNGNLLTVCGTRIDSGMHLTWTYPKVEEPKKGRSGKVQVGNEEIKKEEVGKDGGERKEVISNEGDAKDENDNDNADGKVNQVVSEKNQGHRDEEPNLVARKVEN